MRGGERLGKTNFPGAVRLLPTKPEQAVGIEIPPILYRSFKNLQGEIMSFSVNFSLRALLEGGVSGIIVKKRLSLPMAARDYQGERGAFCIR